MIRRRNSEGGIKMTGILLCLSMVLFSARADDVYRGFSSAEGKNFRGRVLSFDARKGTVKIEAENGKWANVPLSDLSEKDQEYVWEWDKAQIFLDERLFKISCDERVVDESKDEVRQDFQWNTRPLEKDRLMNTIYREKTAYEFELNNNSPKTLSGIRIEYRIYYEQSKTSTASRKPTPEQKVYKGSKELANIPSGDSITLRSEPVEVYNDEINPVDQMIGGDPRQGGEGEVHGIRARFFMKLSTGEEVMREVSQPSSLSEDRFPW